jgi:hypothetical protein
MPPPVMTVSGLIDQILMGRSYLATNSSAPEAEWCCCSYAKDCFAICNDCRKWSHDDWG